MENKNNISEILKDCPKGMELYSPIFGKVYLDKIRPHLAIVVTTDKEQGDFKEEFLYDGRYGMNGECMLFPSKGKTTWEGFQRPFKDGDILISGLEDNPFIFKRINGLGNAQCYCAISCFGQLILNNDNWTCIKGCRLATEEEKAQLFQAIKDNGYRWNEETKTLEKLPKFKDGDIVVSSLGHIHILKNRSTSYIYVDFAHNTNGSLCKSLTTCVRVVRLATEEEKQKLFDAIKANGYKWNSETKTLEKLLKFKVGDKIVKKDNPTECWYVQGVDTNCNLDYFYHIVAKGKIANLHFKEQDDWELVPDKFDITTLKPFDKVLVRTFYEEWKADFFSHYSKEADFPYSTVGKRDYYYCIPYEGNEHLCGTTNDCDEYYKNWE